MATGESGAACVVMAGGVKRFEDAALNQMNNDIIKFDRTLSRT